MALDLRPRQQELIRKLRQEIAAGNTRLVAYGPTGFGKSVVIEAMTRNVIEKGKRVAIIANRIHLIEQLSERFAESGIHHGIVQGQNSHTTHAQVVICSIQTVARRGLPIVDAIFIDEGHACAGSKDFRKVIFHNSALPIVAFSATPFSKGMAKPYPELGGEPLFQKLVVSATIRQLIDEGFLVDCDIFAPSEPDLTGVQSKRNKFGELDYDEKQLEEAVDKPQLVGDIVSHWLRMSRGKPTVCFATSIAHSMHIVEEFKRVGVSAVHLDCHQPEDMKKQTLADFKAGKFTILSNVALIAEGFDHPAAEVMILARPTKSLIRFIQMAGRVLRIHHGKEKALILDHSGSTNQLGYPTDDLPLELDDGSPKQGGGEKKEKKERKCPKCSYVKKSGGKCPQCGFEPVKQAEAVEVADGELSLVQRGKKAGYPEKQTVYSQLKWIQTERGYSDGWTANQYRNIFSVWPKGMADIPMPPTTEVRNFVKAQLIRFAKGKAKGERRAA